jgi:Sulfotransferase family
MITDVNAKTPQTAAAAPKAASTPVDRPIFFVGAPRSGTTIIFEAFSAHEELSWFSNYLHKFPRLPFLSLISRLGYSNDYLGSKKQNGASAFRLPRPYAVECYPAWEVCCGKKFRTDYLINAKASQAERDKAIGLVLDVMRYQGKSRFATKITGPTRMCYLDSIFPDALYVHVVRDGRAVVNSLMKIEFWKEGGGYEKPWWQGGLSEEDMEVYRRHDKSPLVLAAIQWRRIMTIARQEAAAIDPRRYIEIRYEDTLQQPFATLDRIIEFSQLKHSEKVHDYIKTKSSLKDMNFKFSKDLKGGDISLLNEVLGDVNSQYGYV